MKAATGDTHDGKHSTAQHRAQTHFGKATIKPCDRRGEKEKQRRHRSGNGASDVEPPPQDCEREGRAGDSLQPALSVVPRREPKEHELVKTT